MTRLISIVVAAFFGLTFQALGQSVDRPEGVYALNYAKSMIQGPAAKSQTLNFEGDAITAIGFGANDKPYSIVFPNIMDGKPHPIIGTPAFDSETLTPINPYTNTISRTKDEKVVQTGVALFNPQTKTLTLTLVNATNGNSSVVVFEKQ
jgi:hypothetical protein